MLRPRIIRAIDLPPEEHSIGSLNAFELPDNSVRMACRLSDENYQVGQMAVLKYSMTREAQAQVEYSVDQFFMSYSSLPQGQSLLVETGNIIHHGVDGDWSSTVLEADFLQASFILDERRAFVSGSDGEIFTWRENTWVKEQTQTNETVLAIHGTSVENLIAVGSNGTVLRRGDVDWERINIGIGVDLRCVLVRDDKCYIAGERGLVGVLSGSEFIEFETDLSSDFLSVCAFGGEIYYGDSEFGLSILKDGALEPVANLGYVLKLNAGSDWITTTAGEFVFQFNGLEWRGMQLYYDEGYRTRLLDMSELE